MIGPAPRSGRPVRALLAGSVLATAGILLCVIWLGSQEVRGPVRSLPGGGTLELRGVTYGKVHELVDGNWWQQLFVRSPWQNLGGLSLHGYHTVVAQPADALVLWFRATTPTQLDQPLSTSAVAIDVHGCRLRCCGQGWGSGLPLLDWPSDLDQWPPGSQGETRSAAVLETFPRRNRDPVRYALVQENSSRPLAEFTIPNPSRTTYPVWSAPRCPVSVRSGNTIFTLSDLHHQAAALGPISETTATFHYREDGRATENWRPESVVVRDATGNHLESGYADYTQCHQVTFDALCRRESAWRLRVQFVRSHPQSAPADFLWTVRDIAAPRTDRLVRSGAGVVRGGIRIRLLRLHGAGNVSWESGSGWYSLPGMVLEVVSPKGCQLSLVRVTDQRGRSLLPPVRDGSYWWAGGSTGTASEVLPPGEQEAGFDLTYPKATKRLNLTFAVHRTRTAEFLVRP